MYIYGVCVSSIREINNEKAVAFLKELNNMGYSDYLAAYIMDKNDNGEDFGIKDWLEAFDENGYCGEAAFLKSVIEEVEGVDICCDDSTGHDYIGLFPVAPWAFNDKTRNMSSGEYENILRKYVSRITDEILEIRWWEISDDCDW